MTSMKQWIVVFFDCFILLSLFLVIVYQLYFINTVINYENSKVPLKSRVSII